MNTAIPYSLHQPGLRDPVNCLRSFLAKVKALAINRGDHGSALEHNVLGKFVEREDELRSTASKVATVITDRLGELKARFNLAVSDGVVTPRERKEIEKRMARIDADTRTLGAELIVPKE